MAFINTLPCKQSGYPRKTGQLEDSHRDLKCRKARRRWLRIQKPEALMLQSVPPYVDTQQSQTMQMTTPNKGSCPLYVES